MILFERAFGGAGRIVVILHGLFGSSQNWAGMGRRLSDVGRIVGLDLRNHGDSPRGEPHALAACVEDLHEWCASRAEGPVTLIGHSMGGLVAMGFAVRHPGLTAGVASIDIAPRPYQPGHEREYRALRTDITGCRSRADLDALLAPILPEARERQFMLTNAVRDGEGFRWRLDPGVLEGNTVAADWATVTGRFDGPALLVAGGRSPYVGPGDAERARGFFPRLRVEILLEADHWPHVTDGASLERILRAFIATQ